MGQRVAGLVLAGLLVTACLKAPISVKRDAGRDRGVAPDQTARWDTSPDKHAIPPPPPPDLASLPDAPPPDAPPPDAPPPDAPPSDAPPPDANMVPLGIGMITHICAHATIQTGKPYSLKVKYLASGWGIKLTSSCTATFNGSSYVLSIHVATPSWTPDSGYYGQETTCLLPAAAVGTYLLGTCNDSGAAITIGSTTTGTQSCAPVTC